jgi:hypothetical protein
MDPISMILSTLVAGASAALGETAEQAVKDAYAGVKSLIVAKYKGAAQPLQVLEVDPTSKEHRERIRHELATKQAADDGDLISAAQTLARTVDERAPEKAAAVGVNLSDIIAAGNILLERLNSGNVVVKGARAGGDFVLRDVTSNAPKE